MAPCGACSLSPKLQVLLAPQDLKAFQFAELAELFREERWSCGCLLLGVTSPQRCHLLPLTAQAEKFLCSADKKLPQSNEKDRYISINI